MALCAVMIVFVIGLRRFTRNPSIIIMPFRYVSSSFSHPVWFHPATLVALIAGGSLSSVNGF